MKKKSKLVFIFSLLSLVSYISIMKKTDNVLMENSLLTNTRNFSDYISQIRSVADQSSGAPLVTFTNSAQKNFVKSFICNLVSLDGSALASQLVVVVSDRDTFMDLKSFNKDITVVLKPLNSSNQDLQYGTSSYEDYIEYR